MPLIQGKSKKAFKKNVEIEMHAGKPQKQSLAIAFSVQRKNRKRMAHGGMTHEDKRESEHEMHEVHPDCMAHGGEAHMHEPHSECMAHGGRAIRKHEMPDHEEPMPHEEMSEDAYADGGKAEQHHLDTSQREHIKSKNFAEPKERKYPIEDEAHARNALARVSQFGSPEEKAEVRRKVHAKYPSIGEDHKAKGGYILPTTDDHSLPNGGDLSREKVPSIHHPSDKSSSLVDRIMRKRTEKMRFADGGMVDLDDHSHVDEDDQDELDSRNEEIEMRPEDEDLGHDDPMDSNEHGDSEEEESENEDSKDIISQIRSRMRAKRG